MSTGNPPPTPPPKGGFEGIERAINEVGRLQLKLVEALDKLANEVYRAKHDYGM